MTDQPNGDTQDLEVKGRHEQAAPDVRPVWQTPDGATVPTEPSDASSGLLFFLLVPIAVAAAFVGIDAISDTAIPDPNDGFATGVEAIAFISAAALLIERTLEGLWTAIGSKLGGWWPLRSVTKSIEDYEKQTNVLLSGPFTHAVNALAAAKEVAREAGKDVTELDRQLAALAKAPDRLRDKVKAAQKLASGSPRFQMVSEVADDGITAIRTALDQASKATGEVSDKLVDAAEEVAAVCDQTAAFITSFSDNPARKIASLCLGAAFGLIVAAFLGLNMFVAVLEGDVEGQFAGLTGVLFTGVIIGFGANPTHEVIKALQRRKADSTASTSAAPAPETTTVVNVNAASASRHSGVRLLGSDAGGGDTMIDLDPVTPVTIVQSMPATSVTPVRTRTARTTD
jgi:hypothetical protein